MSHIDTYVCSYDMLLMMNEDTRILLNSCQYTGCRLPNNAILTRALLSLPKPQLLLLVLLSWGPSSLESPLVPVLVYYIPPCDKEYQFYHRKAVVPLSSSVFS